MMRWGNEKICVERGEKRWSSSIFPGIRAAGCPLRVGTLAIDEENEQVILVNNIKRVCPKRQPLSVLLADRSEYMTKPALL